MPNTALPTTSGCRPSSPRGCRPARRRARCASRGRSRSSWSARSTPTCPACRSPTPRQCGRGRGCSFQSTIRVSCCAAARPEAARSAESKRGHQGGVGVAQSSASVADTRPAIQVNGRTLHWPRRPTVVICLDGGDPSYLEAADAADAIPHIDGMMRDGFAATCEAAMPTFTNPNNLSIVCGAPPSVHGVSGNYYLDRRSGKEVMMLDATPVRAPTILAAFSRAGASVIAITAKDKLRKALAKDLKGIAFSAQDADRCSEAENGISNVLQLVGRDLPDQYSAELSLFVLDAGVRLLALRSPDLMYLSLSDYVQHKHAPDSPEA